MAATEHVILVDKNDNPTGVAEKMQAHREGLCHRAFSVFIVRFTPEPELLLQQRAQNKYHSPGLWTNTCCSHPRPGEEIINAARRRLYEEMGIDTDLTHLGRFHYIAHFPNGLIENEMDHVLMGKLDQETIHLNPEEAQAYRWITLPDLHQTLQDEPHQFTPWFKEALTYVRL